MKKATPPQTSRQHRHKAIHDLIESYHVRNQAELQDLLDGRGFDVNQGTLSRDLRELGVMKGAGGYHIADSSSPRTDPTNTLRAALAQWLLDTVVAQNQVLLKTPPGGAQPLALAIDQADLPLVLGTLGGDDTILVICANHRNANKLARQLEATA